MAKYHKMADREIVTVVGRIIETSSSLDEVRGRIKRELCYPHGNAVLNTCPDGCVGQQTPALTMRNGARIQVIIRGNQGTLVI
jgi:hypothetical protein